MKPADYCFEVSWEVCNKVGGIYTVLSSKAAAMKHVYKDGYIAVGPYFEKKVSGEFKEKPPSAEFEKVFALLKDQGIICHFGNWLVESEPDAILLDFTAFAERKNDIKTKLWDNFKIDSLGTQYFDYDEPVVWATAGRRVRSCRQQYAAISTRGIFTRSDS